VRIPFEWLSEFLVLDVEPYDLAKKLTMRGLEVESVEKVEASFQGVFVGEITEIGKHPDANLSLCRVNLGSHILPLVCGAKNIALGDRVPVATLGARLADGTVIEKRAIRGVESAGMLCSEKELGLSDEHSGIFILPDTVKVGDALEDAPWVTDVVFDVNVPPNRGDCLSVFGIAREIGSILNQKAKLPFFTLEEDGTEDIESYVSLSVLNPEGCPRYVLRMIKGVTIGPSPFWMRSRLLKSGMRPISSIVDVTNYVMLELGQPLHAFDYQRIRDRSIEVRVADRERLFRTLDSEERRLEEGDVLICDGQGPVAVAGIMGGENSEITEQTKDVALESAYFNPLFIRRTARRLGLRSEASLRFEKGIDFDNVDFAAQRAIFLMHALSGGTVVKGKKELVEKKEPKNIFVSFAHINGVLGTYIEQRDITSGLGSIDLHVVKEEEDGLLVSIPNFRHDLEEYMDIIEEVARIYGYDRIQATTPVSTLQVQKKDRRNVYFQAAKDCLRSLGCFELINFAFFSPKDVENFLIPPDDERAACVAIMNPISKEYEVMRTFVAAGVLKTIAYNLNRSTKNLRVFEAGKTFFLNKEGAPSEYVSLCFAITGKERDFYWREAVQECDFFDLKGILEGLMGCFGVDFSVDRTKEPFLNSSTSADILIDGAKLGWIGEIRDEVLNAYEIGQKVFCAELRFDPILRKGNLDVQYTQIPRYPQATRDFSFYVGNRVPVSMLIERIRNISPLITSVGVFDMFKRESTSISLRVVFQSFEDTLKDDTISSLQETIIKELTGIEGVTLRT
jgi:phenylalanyl-tRNA synthetase beta chain